MSKMFANYEIISELGRGTFGIVYKALDSNRKEIALKIVHLENAETEMKARFLREVRAGYTVQHRNVVKCLHHGEHEKNFFLVSELIDGCSLKQKKEIYKFSEDQALRTLTQILLGLNAIDNSKMIHRDIKPANILISNEGIVKIADLGLVKSNSFEDYQTATGTKLGTPLYMSPEQINGDKNIDIRTDLYSVGILLFELLSGEPPYTGASRAQILYKHCEDAIPDIRDYQQNICSDVAMLIKKLMAKSQQQRPTSPHQVLKILGGFNIMNNIISSKTAITVHFDEATAIDIPKPSLSSETSLPLPHATTTIMEESSNFSDDMDGSETLDLKRNQDSKQICMYTVSSFTDSNLNKKRLSRAKLTIQTKTSTKTLFIYAGSYAVLGRNSIDFEGQTICLRHLEDHNIQKTKTISGKHFSLIMEQNKVFIMDLHSKGTWVDNEQLHSFIPRPLAKEHHVNLSNTLKLKLQISPQQDVLRKIVMLQGSSEINIGQIQNYQKGIVIERTNDRKDHFYAIIPGYIKLKIGRNTITPDPNGELELMAWAGYLWLCGFHDNKHVCKPIVENDSFAIFGCKVHVSKIKLEDQKGKNYAQ